MEASAAELHQRNVVCSASEAEDHDLHLLVSLVEPIGETRCGGLVDYPLYLEACDFSCVLCSLALVVVEVGGDCDDHLLYRPSKECLSVSLDFLEDECGYLLGAVLFSVDSDLVVAAAHFTLDLPDCPLGIVGLLSDRGFAHDPLSLLCERDHRREHLPCGSLALSTGND